MEWTELKARLATYNNTLTQCNFEGAVTTSMPRTFLLGNGDLAVISNGTKTVKEYLLAKGDFWSCGDLKTDAVMKAHPKRVTPLPIGSIQIRSLSCADTFSESLDIPTAKLTSVYDDITAECFCLSSDNVILLRLTSETAHTVEFSLKTNDNQKKYPARAFLRDGKAYLTRSSANFAKRNPLSWRSEVALTARSAALGAPKISGSRVTYTIDLPKNTAVDIFVAVGGGGKTYDHTGALQQEEPCAQANALLDELSWDAAFSRHCAWWQEYWMKSYVFVSDFEMEQYYYGSLYLMACCSRDGKLAPGLYGNFITTDNPRWNGDYHMNYNFIAPFYGMYKANRADFAKPMKDPMLAFIPEGKRRAKKDLKKISRAYICGKLGRFSGRKDLRHGIDNAVLYPVALGPYGTYAWSQNGGYLSQMNDCAFTCMGLTAYYFYTLDKNYLNDIKELLLLNVNFFRAWREKETLENGTYRYNLWSGAHEGTLELNAPHVIASIKNILECLLDGAERGFLEFSADTLQDLQDFYVHLPAYPLKKYRHKALENAEETEIVSLGEKGVVYYENHATVALEFIHPGEDMHFHSDPKLKQAARNVVSLHKRVNTDIFRQINNLPKIFIHAIRAGFDPEAIIAEFKNLYAHDFVYNYSVRDFYETHGIEKAGGIEFINSMLLDSDMRTVKVFPNFPKNRDAQFYNMLARGAFSVSAAQSAEYGVEYVEISSLVQNKISIVNPFENAFVADENGNRVTPACTKTDFGEVLSFNAVPKQIYRITKA